jgi:hypothetical protein
LQIWLHSRDSLLIRPMRRGPWHRHT